MTFVGCQHFGHLQLSPLCFSVPRTDWWQTHGPQARRAHVTKVKFGHSTEKHLEELSAQKTQQLRDARDAAGPGGGLTIDSLYAEAKKSRHEERARRT